MRELSRMHTAKYITEEILKILNKYNFKLDQLFSFTSDNGSNIIKARLSLTGSQKNDTFACRLAEGEVINIGEVNIDDDGNGEAKSDGEEVSTNNLNSDELVNESYPKVIQIQYDDNNILNEVSKEMRVMNKGFLVCLRCACHTIELAVSDF